MKNQNSFFRLKEILINNDESPQYYKYYPRLFEPYFPQVDQGVVNHLCKAGYSYYLSTLLMDSLVDEADFSGLPLMHHLQDCIVQLASIFGTDSEFWQLWNKRKEEYYGAIKLERRLNHVSTVSKKDYERLADAKSAFGKLALDALFILSGKRNIKQYELLVQTHKFFSIGLQLYDDVTDFKKDYDKANQFNWAIYNIKQDLNGKQLKDSAQLNKLLFIRGKGQSIYKDAINYLQKAIDLTGSLNMASKWEEVITETKKSVANDLDTTNGYIAILNKKISLQKVPSSRNCFFDYSKVEDDTISRALRFINYESNRNYPGLKHIMYLGRIFVSDTFQRALINDCIFDVTSYLRIDPKEYLDTEIEYLLNKRNNDDVGGWCYYPGAFEIAADIDDLGQILQLLQRCERGDLIEKYCVGPIKMAISERSCANGGIETWIIPKSDQTKRQRVQEYFNQNEWGTGPDVEVVANFLFSLELYDSDVYSDTIDLGLNFIAKKQDNEGYWGSKWYYGEMYGTYVCLRSLNKSQSKYAKTIDKALKYIKLSQNADGGFGMNRKSSSDPLSTAFAILALNYFYSSYKNEVERAKEYLILNQAVDGSWESIDFIKPKLGESYGSKIMTTGFVLKSLCQ